MPIKASLTEAEYVSLPTDSKSLYVQSGDGFKLDLVGGYLIENDPTALLNAKQHEVEKRKAVEAELKAIKDKADLDVKKSKQAAENKVREDALKNQDVAALHADLERQIKTMQDSHAKEIASQRKEIAHQQELVKQTRMKKVASDIATKISTTPSLLSPLVMQRLDIDSSGNVIAKDKNGQMNDNFTLGNLEKEFIDNSEFAPIIIGSKASGASGSTSSGSPVETSGKKWKDFSSEQLVQLRKENPSGYQDLKATRDE
jgi:hypothetical protein|tara:strand:- start:2549 stop:3322 length:774 start_codon:yes stop_codon:yes gene_type:complete